MIQPEFKMTQEDIEELMHYEMIVDSGYELAATAHEEIKNDPMSEKDIWVKEEKYYIGNTLEELREFDGYVKDLEIDGVDMGVVVIDNSNPQYSLENVTKEAREFMDEALSDI